jgi:N-dimethylarginine dimethylaminohydrolase
VLGDTIAFLPEAFTASSVRVLRQLFPTRSRRRPSDAAVLGLNAVSDGHHVVMPVQAAGLAKQLAERGYEARTGGSFGAVEGGRGPKCCTLELRSA